MLHSRYTEGLTRPLLTTTSVSSNLLGPVSSFQDYLWATMPASAGPHPQPPNFSEHQDTVMLAPSNHHDPVSAPSTKAALAILPDSQMSRAKYQPTSSPAALSFLALCQFLRGLCSIGCGFFNSQICTGSASPRPVHVCQVTYSLLIPKPPAACSALIKSDRPGPFCWPHYFRSWMTCHAARHGIWLS